MLRPKGVTLPELIVAMSIFSMLAVAFASIMNYGMRTWVSMEGRHLCERDLRQAEFALLRDLRRSRADRVGCATTANLDGGLLWMNYGLRRGGALDGQPCRDIDGLPIWQSTVIYYLVRPAPALHQQLYGYQCAVWSGPGPDPLCPHKLLLRREVETLGHTAVPPVAAESEPFPASLSPWIGSPEVRPLDMRLSNLPAGGVVQSKIVCLSMLTFNPQRPAGQPDRVSLTLAAVRRQEAEKFVSVGNYDFSANRRFVVEYTSSAIPGI